MSPERTHFFLHDLRWRLGLRVFGVLLAVGSACGWVALREVQERGSREAGVHARAMAQSVADTLAQQLARAVRLGIPLQDLPGVPLHLEATLARQPLLVALAVKLPDGRTLHGAGHAAALETDAAHAVFTAAGLPVGRVVAGAGEVGAWSTDSVRTVLWACAVGLVLALAAALVAACGPGARLERQRRAVLARLALQAQDSGDRGGVEGPLEHGPQAMLVALDEGDAEQAVANQALGAYAQELLAVDFDGRMRADIERIMRAAEPTPMTQKGG